MSDRHSMFCLQHAVEPQGILVLVLMIWLPCAVWQCVAVCVALLSLELCQPLCDV